MTDIDGWQHLLSEDAWELLDRETSETLDAASAYRLLVLLGRARQLSAPTPEVEQLRVFAASASDSASLAARVYLPQEDEMLAELDVALEGGAGPEFLHSLLLDVDDLATVLELLGHTLRARELGRRAAEHVPQAHPRLAPLAPWAEARLATLGEDSAILPLWREVVRSRRGVVIPLFRLDASSAPGLPLRQAAASAPRPLEPVSGDGFELYESEGHCILWVAVVPGSPTPPAIELRLRAGEREGRWSYRVSHADEQGIYVDLGTPDELRQRAARALGALPGEEEPYELVAFPATGTGNEPDSSS